MENTNQPDYSWRRRIFKPRELFSTTNKVQLLFIAKESGSTSTGNSLVEAAVDDFIIYEGADLSSVDETKVDLASIYPNPVSGTLQIVMPGNIDATSIQFFDLTGKVAAEVAVTKGASHYAIETSTMVPGQYFLVIKMGSTIQTRPVTIAH
ncbi:MAG: T9SS type A sorting domain-containing protein [Chitinophagaceae bacterium]